MGITGCILAKNEEKRIEYCIKSISKIADEIIVIDNGSSDNTVSIAKKLGAIVSICSDKKLDKARNEYLKLASKEWIFVLDADECIDNTTKGKVNELLESHEECTSFMVPRYEYIGSGQWALTELCRLFRNDKKIYYSDTAMHASIGESVRRMGGINGAANFAIHHFDGLLGNERMYEKRKRNIELSIEDIECLKREGKDLYYLYSYLGLEYAALGDYEKAESIYKEAIIIGCDYKQFAHIYLAQNYLLQGKYRQAYDVARLLVGVNNDIHQRALLLLAEIELRQNCYEKALNYCMQIEEYNLYNAANKLNLATLLLDKDRDKASNYLMCAKEINPYIMNPLIYRQGAEKNIYTQQTMFLSCTKSAKELEVILSN